jgi:membrane protein EpsK
MYAAILLIPSAIRNISVAISSAFSPTTVILYSLGNMGELCIFTNRVVKICGMLVGWPVAIASGLAIPILQLWLGKDYTAYELPIILLLIPLTVNLAVHQLYIVQQATNKVKIPAIASIIFGVMNVLLAIFLTASLGLGILGIVLSGAIMSTIGTVIFDGIYTAIITNQPKYAYFRGLLPPLVVTIITCAAGILMQEIISITSIFTLFFSTFFLSILYVSISIGLLSPDERKLIKDKVLSIFVKSSHKAIQA